MGGSETQAKADDDGKGGKPKYLEWTGDWSDKSELWTPELRRQLAAEDREDGVFWMSLESFIEFFVGIHICKYVDGYKFSNYKLRDG